MGKHSRSHTLTSTGLSPAPAPLSNGLRPHARFLTPHPTGRQGTSAPTTPLTQPLPGITRKWFSLIRFRSPLLSESLLFSLPTGTEMFHFPVFPPHTLFHSGAGNWTQLQLGFPIRTSPDQRSVANSPGHIAGSHVLHRLSMPRHPPCALTNLPHKPPTHTTNKTPALHASDPCIQNDQDTKRYTTLQTKHTPTVCACSRPLSNNQTTRSPTSPHRPSRTAGV